MKFREFYDGLKSWGMGVGLPLVGAYAVGSVIIVMLTIIVQFAYKKLSTDQIRVCNAIYIKEGITIAGLIIFVLLYKSPYKDELLSIVSVIIVFLWIVRLIFSITMGFVGVYNKLPRTSASTALKIFSLIFYMIDVIVMSIISMILAGAMGYALMIILSTTLDSKTTPDFIQPLLDLPR